MSPTNEFCTGSCTLVVTVLCHFLQDLFPVVTMIGALCGAILGIHGVARLIVHYLRGKNMFR